MTSVRKVLYCVGIVSDGVRKVYCVEIVSDGVRKVSEGVRKVSDCVRKVSDGDRSLLHGVRRTWKNVANAPTCWLAKLSQACIMIMRYIFFIK